MKSTKASSEPLTKPSRSIRWPGARFPCRRKHRYRKAWTGICFRDPLREENTLQRPGTTTGIGMAGIMERQKQEIMPRTNWTSDRKSTRLNSSHVAISYAVFCLTKKKEANEE